MQCHWVGSIATTQDNDWLSTLWPCQEDGGFTIHVPLLRVPVNEDRGHNDDQQENDYYNQQFESARKGVLKR